MDLLSFSTLHYWILTQLLKTTLMCISVSVSRPTRTVQKHWHLPGPTHFQSRWASLKLVGTPTVIPVDERWTSVPLLVPPPATKPGPLRVICLALSARLAVWRERDMMLWLCNLGRRDIGGVPLSCVAWNGGTPPLPRRLPLCGGSGVGFLHLDGVADPFLCSWFLGSLLSVSSLSVLGFCPIFPVTYSIKNVCQQMWWSSFG